MKSQLYRALANDISRSEKSIEFKFQNISAVLDEMGMEWIRGLAPRRNFQRALATAVERHLPAFLSIDLSPFPDGMCDPAGLYIEPAPERSLRSHDVPDFIDRLVKKFDPIERDKQNRSLGHAGEELVFHFERQSLEAHQREDLASKVKWVARDEGDGAGYDILSFEPNGVEKFIEVKTTVGGSRTPFYISRNETEFSREAGGRFRLFRLFNFRREPRAFELVGAIDNHMRLTAQQYRADFEA